MASFGPSFFSSPFDMNALLRGPRAVHGVWASTQLRGPALGGLGGLSSAAAPNQQEDQPRSGSRRERSEPLGFFEPLRVQSRGSAAGPRHQSAERQTAPRGCVPRVPPLASDDDAGETAKEVRQHAFRPRCAQSHA